MSETKKQTWLDSLAVYKDIRMVRILLLGAISGFPWVLIGSSLSLWLKEDGLSRSTIGWAGLIFAVYAFNYLWAPIIDRIRIPWLTNKIGIFVKGYKKECNPKLLNLAIMHQWKMKAWISENISRID